MRLIAITGGLGFIGTNLVPVLRRTFDAPIRILDNGTNPSEDLQPDPDVEVVSGDIRDSDAVARLLDGAEAVVHLAAHTRVIDSIEDPALNFDINVRGTFNIMEQMRRNGIRTLVNASTGGAILGEVPPPIHEEIAAKPASPYGASKLATEGYCWAYAQSYGLNATSLRFSNIYGPHCRNKASVVAAFLKHIVASNAVTVYGDGSQTRDFLYVGDLVEGIAAAMKAGVSGVYQLGAGRPTSVNALIEVLRAVTGRDFTVSYEPFRAGELLHTHCDIGKARTDIGFDPTTQLEEGVAATWQWFRDKNLA